METHMDRCRYCGMIMFKAFEQQLKYIKNDNANNFACLVCYKQACLCCQRKWHFRIKYEKKYPSQFPGTVYTKYTIPVCFNHARKNKEFIATHDINRFNSLEFMYARRIQRAWRRFRSARIIQRHFREAISNPNYKLCLRRLNYEFNHMKMI